MRQVGLEFKFVIFAVLLSGCRKSFDFYFLGSVAVAITNSKRTDSNSCR